jgi:hypothetical protein
MLARNSEDVERREVRRLAPRFHIKLRSDPPNEFCFAAFRGKHPSQKEQIAGLHRFRIGAERRGRRRELDAEFFQTLLGVGRTRDFGGLPLALSNLKSLISFLLRISHLIGYAEAIKPETCGAKQLDDSIVDTELQLPLLLGANGRKRRP